MNYEFHVGDYVEVVGGAKGYVCDANKDWWYCTSADDEYSVGYVYRIVRLGRGDIHKCYNRIGSYDFAKKEKKKIGLLKYNGSPDWDDSLLLDKINELVDAVNLLLDKSTES